MMVFSRDACSLMQRIRLSASFLGCTGFAAMCWIAGGSALASPLADEGALRPDYLRCEYRVDPLGIDVRAPRLSWEVQSEERAQRQTAYHVLVASEASILGDDRGDLWDSGKVESDETAAVVYRGKPLASRQRCVWKVRVWDRDGRASGWSAPALWTMGLLEAADWTSEWIGHDQPRETESPEAPLDGAKWIWFAGDEGANAPKGVRVFMTSLALPGDVSIARATLVVTADDRYSFNINGQLVASSGDGADSWKQPKKVDVTERLRGGANTIRVQVENAIESPAGLLAKLVVEAADGRRFQLVTDGSWRSTDSPGADWHAREIAPDAWPACRVVGEYGVAPWGKLRLVDLLLPAPVHLRSSFRLAGRPRRAMLYATALGNCDVYLNGKRVSEERFTPGWTDYAKRVYYRTYDVTEMVREGDNAWGAVLADGWYSGHIGWGRIRDHYGKKNRFRGQLHVELADGTSAVVGTGRDWKAATGPTLEADFLMGETYDARLEMPGWCETGFDDGAWESVATGAELSPAIEPHPGPPVVAVGESPPVRITEPEKGAYVLDLGRNFAGHARLKVRGKRGQRVVLRFAERLNPDGTLYTTNLRGARAIDTYICRGGGTEVWEPRFTFHGFQYVEVTGLEGRPDSGAVVGVALSSDTQIAGEFSCSDPMLNQLVSNTFWTQRANFIDIPTDCPQRDERLGWTGDAQVYIRTATLHADVHAFFIKWLVDLEDGQREDGQFPCVAPVKVAGADGGPAWADAGTICPWTVYEVYGDRRVLETHYDAMTRFIDFCQKRSTPELLPPRRYHCFGDWLSIKADTPKDVIYTAYFACSTKLTARAAEVLGKTEDARRYHGLYERIKAAFQKAYVAPDGRIRGNTQTCYVLALAFDLVDGDLAEKAARYLVEDIESRDGHLSTGFIGTKDLMLVLSKIGRDDVAYRLIHNDTFPSWGFSIQHGATSIWERWDGWTPEKGFQDPGMNSFAHYSFGAVYQWMVETIGGIRSDGPAYKSIVIAPHPGGKLTSAS
ncbi:MAG: family 78 glycoside hydrolase catalytic domain, partial [Planctomycetes bacterium]|nr:family 78 glycoside hydrolase catalytic domain [Planctomycetota bacterium]